MGEDDPSDAYWSWSVRLNLASGAAATAKLTLDAALAGYYSPAYGLLRHLAETWEQIVYLQLDDQAARQWFSPDGVEPARVPSKGTILAGIRKRGKAEVGLRAIRILVGREREAAVGVEAVGIGGGDGIDGGCGGREQAVGRARGGGAEALP